MERLDDAAGVGWPVEEVGVAKRDVLGAPLDLGADVGKDDVDRDDAKLAVVDRHDRAVPAAMLAAARRIGRSRQRAGSRRASAATRTRLNGGSPRRSGMMNWSRANPLPNPPACPIRLRSR